MAHSYIPSPPLSDKESSGQDPTSIGHPRSSPRSRAESTMVQRQLLYRKGVDDYSF
ncbi:hypothetical protein HMI54_002839 [Coelomomyces lativittatus]|nr:hypothetical protein HMI55_002319 [Coelomomyces lativittatus]KAJ1508898.1 hypothetical protein HMI54_002839 [Coelomomyces lativittatus]